MIRCKAESRAYRVDLTEDGPPRRSGLGNNHRRMHRHLRGQDCRAIRGKTAEAQRQESEIMTLTKFNLELKIGNYAAMRNGQHIADALQKVARKYALEYADNHDFVREGVIQDENGNTVGKYSVK